MPRARPNKWWLISKPPSPTARPLSAAQRDRLKAITGLPEAALPAVEKIAERFIELASHPIPSNPEMRAAARLLRRSIAALQGQIRKTDVFTLHEISHIYAQILYNDNPRGVLVQHVVGIAENELNALARAIELTAAQSLPVAKSSTLPNQVRAAFQQFGVLFSLSKKSPAIETVEVILNMVRPTGYEAARQAVGRVVTKGYRKKAPV
jgi:hypothetical protein